MIKSNMPEELDINKQLEQDKQTLQEDINRAIANAPITEIEEGNAKILLDRAREERRQLNEITESKGDRSMIFEGISEPNEVVIDDKKANLYPILIQMSMESIGVPEENRSKILKHYTDEEFGHMVASYDAEGIESRMYGVNFIRYKNEDGNEHLGMTVFIKLKGKLSAQEYYEIISAGRTSDEHTSLSDEIKLGNRD